MAMTQDLFRVGIGYDVHRLVEGRDLILGGVSIPYSKGLSGYSDADVLIHAIIDAILGALGKGDIGQHFPDSDPTYKNADSIMLLREVVSLAHEEGFRLNNLDASIIAQKPKLASYLGAMEERIKNVLDRPCCVNVKATTTEGLGFCGREEGIAACAVVSLLGK
jgi:2-C-methyl-D-erythritol 2,4-cyclodiphosphate synthase